MLLLDSLRSLCGLLRRVSDCIHLLWSLLILFVLALAIYSLFLLKASASDNLAGIFDALRKT